MNKHFYNLSTDKASFKQNYKNALRVLVILVVTCFVNTVNAQCWDFTCFENTELTMNSDCIGTRNAGLMLVNPTQCLYGPKEVTFFHPTTNEPLGDSLGIEFLDETLPYKVLNVWTGDECYGTVTVVDKRGPDVDCQNVTVKCTEQYDVTSIGTPGAVDNCTSVAYILHEDEEIDFACGETGFTGYFAPENWNTCTIGSDGDGGVDVTGAPNSISVEGAENSPVSDNCPYVTKFKIELPAEGYISFDWSSIGGSDFAHESAFFTVGDTCVQLTLDGVTSGSYTSWLIEPGTWISFEVTSNGDANNLTAFFENFHFYTPAIKVIHRNWTAYDEYFNEGYCTQVITIERTYLEEVQFPPNRDGVAALLLECGEVTSPTFTEPSAVGMPFLDADGDLSTTDDQSQFSANNECRIDVYHNDVVFPECDGNYTIARTWTVYNQCTEETIDSVQVIRVADTMPPVFDCPEDMTVSTDFSSCSANFTVPAYEATDECSTNISYSSSWSFGNSQSVYNNIPEGTHTLTLTATDGCENTATCTMNVTVTDQIAPTVICDAITAAAVTSDGTSIVYAETLDDGSYDECCEYGNLIFDVKLADAPNSDYAPTILFDCGQIGGTVNVNLRVTDCNGNSNFCTVEVNVQDNQAPALLCPDDVVVDCGTDISDLAAFGTVSGADNCSYEITETSNENLNTCGIGSVTRNYTITDPTGNTSQCQQIISIVNLIPWNENGDQINFPADYTVNAVCGESVHPDNLPAMYAYPTYEGVMGCEQPARSFEDEVFYISEPSCYYIQRTWSIMDWCGDGTFFTDVQIITVNDVEAPIFSYPQTDITMELSGGNNCTGTVELTIPEVTDCSEDIEITLSGDLGSNFGLIENIAAGTYNIIYTATDGCGNSNENSFAVTVTDNTTPLLDCPENVTIDCGADFSDLTIYGAPTVTDNCGSADYTLTETFLQTINPCGLGFIERQWAATAENGNTSICQQYIYVENQTPWNPSEGNLQYPQHYTLSGDCEMGTNPEDLPAPYSEPTWDNDGQCTSIYSSYEDETVMIAPPNCYRIDRTWTIKDWCNPNVSWTYVQMISIVDSDAPTFVDIPENITIAPNNNVNCTANYTIEMPTIQDCDPDVSVVLSGDLTNDFGMYDLAVGVYNITYTATDGCGNVNSHSYQITVVDNVAPTAICLSGLTLDIPVNQQLQVTANTFNAASFDNCTSFPNLIFSYSTDLNNVVTTFDCDDLGSNVPLTLYITDEAGNQSTCNTSLQINDNDNNCGEVEPLITPDIIGTILNWENEPVAQAVVALGNANVGDDMTDAIGSYAFLDMDLGNHYIVSPSKDINYNNGVTTIDAYILNDHISGTELLANSYQHIAGDADKSSDLTANDVTQIEDVILYNTNGFPVNTSWRFCDANHIFVDANNPLAQSFPESISIQNLSEDITANFIGIKIGDLNGTSIATNINSDSSEERADDDLVFEVVDITLISGETYTIELKSKDLVNYIAYQFTLDFDVNALTVEEWSNSNFEGQKIGTTKLQDGALTTLWFDKNQAELSGENAVFTLKFKANVNGKLSDYLNISSRYTTALSYLKDKSEVGVVLEYIQRADEPVDDIKDFALIGNKPNPFARKTNIVFEVPQESDVQFTFYTVTGVQLYTTTATYEKGVHELGVSRELLNIETDGIILYRMESGSFAKSSKMIMVQQ